MHKVIYQKKWLSLILNFFLIFSLAVSLVPGIVLADDGPKQSGSPYETIITDASGRQITIAVFPLPPPKTKMAVATVPDVHIAGAINTLSNVPAFDWSYGCSATSAAMLFGYYDRTDYSSMYTGATNGGVCPLDNSVWGHTTYPKVTCGECPLSATHNGIDGRAIKGHVDDYWIDSGDAGPDPWVGNWAEHTLGDCAGDYMGTNQWKYGDPVEYNKDGSTIFIWYTDGDPLYDFTAYEPTYRDGCHGIKLFAESRGYTVVTNFSQAIKGQGTDPDKGFTFADFQSEIDAGRPVIIQVEGHTMLGYGYDTSGNTIYIHDTWDYLPHTMTWGGTYSGLQHRAVTVIRLQAIPPTMTNDSGASNIAQTSARLNGEVTSTGWENPTVHIYWGPSDGGTTPGSWAHDVNLGVKTAGTFYTDISGLTASTPYYYRCYAVNSGGGSWAASTASFTTSTPPTMEPIAEAEGQYYNTAPILSNFGFDDDEALDDGWYQMDSYSGGWTSLFTDAGATYWDSDNWSIPGFDALSQGSHTIYFKASDNASNVEGESGEWGWQFYKDTIAPTDPTSVNSTSHSLSTWSSDNTVDITWTDATDNTSGLDGYSSLWDTSVNTTPSANKTIEEGIGNVTSSELADGNSHYFHIRSVDNAGNWQSTVHLGPFYIETVPPTDPTSVNSTSHTTSVWSSNNTVTISWTDATDATSGLDGYSILWDTSANTTPDSTKDIEEGVQTATSSALTDGSSHYFHIRSVDNAGNWQSTVHLGPFYIDATPPTMEAIAESQGQYYTAAPSFSNFGFDEGSVALDDGWYQMDSYTGNWTALFADAANADFSDIAVASDNTTIYAVDRERDKIYKSTNAGLNWTELTNPTGAAEPQLVAVASDNASIAAIVADGNEVYTTTDGGTSWGSLIVPQETGGGAAATALYDIDISSSNSSIAPSVNFIAVAGTESGPLANIWYYDLGAASPVWKETNDLAGFGATSVNSTASAVAFSPNFASDMVLVAITEEDDGAGGTDNVSFEVYHFSTDTWNTGAFGEFPATITSDDGITGLDSASISMAPDYHGAWDTRRDVFIGLTVAGDATATATSGIYHLNDDNVTELKTGEQIHSVAYDGTNLVAGEYDSTDVWRSADPKAATPTVNVTASNRPGGENKVVIDWAGSKVIAGTSGNLSAFAVSTDNGTSFSDILVITDTSWDNDGWTIPGFDALANGSHTIYFKASDNLGNIEGESGEWSWQFNKGSPPSGGGGGGGGGGGAGLTAVRPYLDREGKIEEAVTAYSEDMKVELYLPVGTEPRSATGTSISSIRIKVMAEPPPRPKDTSTIASIYEVGPVGTTFSPPVDMIIEYDESKIPEGVAEKNLLVTFFDDSIGQWIELESTVATENDTVTTKVSHFSAFTVLACTRPASFSITDLSITPDEIEFGEPVNIGVLVTNDGDMTGSHQVELLMDDVLVQAKEVILDGGDAEIVSFSMTPDTAEEHTINVAGLTGACNVKEPKAPAAFSTSNLIISPTEIDIGESVTISFAITNTGDLSGTHEIGLEIDGVQIETKRVTLNGGESQEVVFTTSENTAGTYAVNIDGLSGSFVVKEEAPIPAEEEKMIIPAPAVTPTLEPGPAPEPVSTPQVKWWAIVGIIIGSVIAGLASYFFIRKRRETTTHSKSH